MPLCYKAHRVFGNDLMSVHEMSLKQTTLFWYKRITERSDGSHGGRTEVQKLHTAYCAVSLTCELSIRCARFQVLKAIVMKLNSGIIFRAVLHKYSDFSEVFAASIIRAMSYDDAEKTTSETSGNFYQTARRNIPENGRHQRPYICPSSLNADMWNVFCESESSWTVNR
jgi:hypothetical protein